MVGCIILSVLMFVASYFALIDAHSYVFCWILLLIGGVLQYAATALHEKQLKRIEKLEEEPRDVRLGDIIKSLDHVKTKFHFVDHTEETYPSLISKENNNAIVSAIYIGTDRKLHICIKDEHVRRE